jgi:hypothetical protein
VYTGTSTTNLNKGEWVQVQLPSAATVAEYYFQFTTNPVAWNVYSTSNTSIWTLVESVTNFNSTTAEIHRQITPTSNSYWRFQLVETGPGPSGFSLLSLAFLDSIGRPVHTLQATSNNYTARNEQVGDSALGTFTFTSSNGNFASLPATFYASSSPVPTANTTTTLYGDWVQLALPSPRAVSAVALSSTLPPSNIRIVASNNLINWTLANYTPSFIGSWAILPVSQTAQYWRMIVPNTYSLTSWYLLGADGHIINNSTGGYYNNVTTFSGGVPGEWLEVSLPVATVSNVIYCSGVSNVTLFGATTYGTWTNLGQVNALYGPYVPFTNSTAYRFYRAVFGTSLAPTITNVYFCNSRGAPILPTMTSNVTVNPSSIVYGNGVLGQYNGTTFPFVSNRSYLSSTGFPVSAANVLVEFPIPVTVTEMTLVRPMFLICNVYGTNDYITYTPLSTNFTISPAYDGQQQIFTNVFPVTGRYRSYQLTILQSLQSNVVSLDDWALFDSGSRINEPGGGNVTTSALFGGSNVASADTVLVTFPSAVAAASYTLISTARSWNVYANVTVPLPTSANLVQTVTDNQFSRSFQLPNQSNSNYLFSFTSTQSTSNVQISRLAMYSQAGFELIPNTFTGPVINI